MKKIIFLVAVLFTASIVKAQDTPTERQQKKEWAVAEGKKNRDSIINALHLTREQGDQIKALAKEGKVKRDKIWSDNTLTDEQKQTKVTELRTDGRKRLASILTKEQQQKLEGLHKKATAKYSRQQNEPQNEPSDVLLESEW